MFSCSSYILFVAFQSTHAFLIYFSKIFTRLLFAPFPLVCCIFNVFFQDFYPSPSVSDRFCTISSGCYRIFLHFHCIFPACLLYRHSLFLAVAPVSSMFQQILHPFILVVITFSCQVVITFSFTVSFQHFPVDFARFPLIVIMFSCSSYILFVGFQSTHAFLIYFSKIFTRLLFAPFPLVVCIFNVFFQEFYPSPLFSERFCTISSGCYRIFLHFHCIFPACLLHRHGLRLAFAPVSSIFQGIFHGLFLAFAPFSSVFQGILYDFL